MTVLTEWEGEGPAAQFAALRPSVRPQRRTVRSVGGGRQLPSSVGDGAASASAIACSVALTARLARRIHSLRSSSVRSGQGFTSPVVSIACPACSLRAIPFIALRLRVALASFIRDSLRSRHRPCFPATRNWQQTTTRPATQTGLDMLNPRASLASPASRLVNPFLEGNASTTQRFPVITGEHERRRPPVSRQLPALSHRQRLSCCEGSRASRFIGVALWRIGWSGRASARRARLSLEDATEWPAPSPRRPEHAPLSCKIDARAGPGTPRPHF